MSLFDTISAAALQHPTVTNLAAKLGIDPAVAAKAIAGLAQAHQKQGDTVDQATATTGLDRSLLERVMAEMGGGSALAKTAMSLGNGSGAGALGNAAGIAGKLFRR